MQKQVCNEFEVFLSILVSMVLQLFSETLPLYTQYADFTLLVLSHHTLPMNAAWNTEGHSQDYYASCIAMVFYYTYHFSILTQKHEIIMESYF